MSVHSCTEFLQAAYDSAEIQREMKAMTGTRELVKLGRRHGYAFDIAELARASSSFTMPLGRGQATPAASAASPAPQPPVRSAGTTFLHYEYRVDEVPGLAPLAAELPRLKVQPPSVDLAAFDRDFRADDLASTSRSPSDPDFQRWHRELAARGWRDRPAAPRRDFHLINLDEHVDHPGYEGYFDAKVRAVDALEALFGGEVRFSGSMWYPPNSYRLWHTNQDQPGWRMYLVDIDADFPDPQRTSFFRYQNPSTGELVTLPERPRIVRFFKAEQDPGKLFWHCIVNPTVRHRWSFGFVVPPDWRQRLGRAG